MALTRTGTVVGLIILVALTTAGGYLGWTMYTSSEQPACQVCERPLHSHSTTLAEVAGGQRESFCCPTCAVTAARQRSGRLVLVRLTDYVSGALLDPGEAYLVRGSDVNPCMEDHSLMHGDKQTAHMDFDRCSPSVLAFGDRATAQDFVANHGGELIRADNLLNQ